MSSKANLRQKTAGTLFQFLTKLPDRCFGMALDFDRAAYKINGRLKIVPALYGEVHTPVENLQALQNIKPDLHDILPGGRVRLLGLDNAGDRAARVMKWDPGQSGETDFDAGIVRPLFNKDGLAWTESGAWVLDFVEKAAPVAVDAAALPTDLSDRVSFIKPVSEYGRLSVTHAVIQNQTRTAPTSSPAVGDTYLLPARPEEDYGDGWEDFAPNELVWWDGEAWRNRLMPDGFTVYDRDTKAFFRYDASDEVWRWERSANVAKSRLTSGSTRPDVRGKYRILPSTGHDDLEALVGMEPGSQRLLYPDTVDITLVHNVDDVGDTPGAVAFSLPAGINYVLKALSNTPLLLERDISDDVIRIIGGGLGDSRADDVAANYVAPTVNVTIQGGAQASGASVSTLTINWTISGGNAVDTIRVRAASGAWVTKASTDRTHTFTGPYTEDTVFEVEVTDIDNGIAGGTTVTDTATLSFGQRIYYGPSAETSLTSTQINALASEFSADNDKTVTYDCTGGRYPYIAVPVAFGSPRAFANGFEVSDLTVATVSHTTAEGRTEDYYVARYNQIQNGASVEVEWR
ncbi:DUF2793 domain-containing protein [Parvularcula sp. LCG005]|uniref:DUF2793 domain-containing protein n=1 Tax=Parvularcula sp. LCG005 TaxID=3078805 RepID=UPI002942B978|nr:DUF2793 domain-containing protein [Parvularcula sp. LCG005]WOI54295.1 DUF2793 domain-containing protein [Parvularcula sp. LCG005]